MSSLSQLAPVSILLLALSVPVGDGLSADSPPAPPEASAPLPPRESSQPDAPAPAAHPSETPPTLHSIEAPTILHPSETPTAPLQAQGSSRPPAKPPTPHSQPATAAVRLPAPERPARPIAPEVSPLTAEAANFMNAYWTNVGGTSDQVLPYRASIYAPVVNYYGKPTPREDVLKEKYNFIRRWPMRQTWLPPSAPGARISCSDATAECEISGVRDFDVVSPERGARSVGIVRYTYRL
jgi:hypothetical protein